MIILRTLNWIDLEVNLYPPSEAQPTARIHPARRAVNIRWPSMRGKLFRAPLP